MAQTSRVLGSTGSTPWISTLVTTSRLFLNSSRGLGRPVSRLMPKTAAWMMLDELRWNVSNGSPATAPRTREAMALHASPTKFDTLNTLVAASTSPCGQSKNQLYASCSDSRAWSEVSTCTRTWQRVMEPGPGPGGGQQRLITLAHQGLLVHLGVGGAPTHTLFAHSAWVGGGRATLRCVEIICVFLFGGHAQNIGQQNEGPFKQERTQPTMAPAGACVMLLCRAEREGGVKNHHLRN